MRRSRRWTRLKHGFILVDYFMDFEGSCFRAVSYARGNPHVG